MGWIKFNLYFQKFCWRKPGRRLDAAAFVLSWFLLSAPLIFAFVPIFSSPQLEDREELSPGRLREIASRIKEIGLKEEKAYEFLKIITSVGGRLTGSPQAEQAVELTFNLMKELGFDQVKKEPVEVRRWVRGEKETALVISSKVGQKELAICALGNSVATPEGGLRARVLEVRSWEELEALKEQAQGKIVFYNVEMDRTLLDSFAAYGQAAQFRVRGPSQAARFGAVASLTRSLTFRRHEYPHTGLMIYDENDPRIPAAALSPMDSERLSQWLKEDPDLELKLELSCHFLSPAISANVLGQITGQLKPEEIILLGAHLDSWDLGQGAHDDAAGCAAVIEALRLIKESGIRPERTIRAVLFMDEEFGGTGGRAYAVSPARKGEKHLVAIEQDRGGFLPIGLAFGRKQEELKSLFLIEPVLRELGLQWMRNGGGGVDIAPLVEQGSIPGSVIPDSQKYFDYHHCALDVAEAVHPRELELQAIILAVIASFLSLGQVNL